MSKPVDLTPQSAAAAGEGTMLLTREGSSADESIAGGAENDLLYRAGGNDGSGKGDLVFRNDASGAAVYRTGTSFGDLGTVLNGLTVVGIADLGG
ncbi:MAG TPA: hypothetical protein VED40_02600 [Azospirillaceae bacterium]|nr:hypothetical protein [Azospirillaceae bacterium]